MTSKPTANPIGDIAAHAAGSGFTVQSTINPNNPPGSSAQAAFNTYASGVLSPDVYQADVAPKATRRKPTRKK